MYQSIDSMSAYRYKYGVSQAMTNGATINTQGFDYKHQAWVEDGRYVACGHPDRPACGCYGSVHAGETIAADAELR